MKALTFALFAFWACAASARAEPAKGAPIGRVIIQADDIFDLTNPSEDRWLFRKANLVHIQTRENVIRRELLLKPGDAYDPDLVAESERNLRRFNFLRQVHVIPQEGPDGTVDLLVKTRDTWTLEPEFDYGRTGNKTTTKVGVIERNFAGMGKDVQASVHDTSQGRHETFKYRDKQVLGGKLELNAKYQKGNGFQEYGAALSRPFRSSLSRYSWEVAEFVSREELSVSRDTVELGKYDRQARNADVAIGRSFGNSTRVTRQGTLTFRRDEREYRYLSGNTLDYVRPHSDVGTVEPGFAWQRLDYIKERHIETFDRDEDFNLGAGASLSVGLGRDWGADPRNLALPQAAASGGFLFGDGHFALATLKARSRVTKARTDDVLASTDLQYFNRLSPDNTLAAHVSYDHGWRLEPENLLLLGEDWGLHGYSNGQFTGDRKVLFNLEDRMFFADDVFHLVSFGGALFFDSGCAWQGSQGVSAKDLRSSVGIGLRAAPSRSSRNEPIKVDLAYALNRNDQNSRWVLSVQTGLKFGVPPEKRSGI